MCCARRPSRTRIKGDRVVEAQREQLGYRSCTSRGGTLRYPSASAWKTAPRPPALVRRGNRARSLRAVGRRDGVALGRFAGASASFQKADADQGQPHCRNCPHSRISACDPKSARFRSQWRRTHRSVRLKAPKGWGRYHTSPLLERGVATTAESRFKDVWGVLHARQNVSGTGGVP